MREAGGTSAGSLGLDGGACSDQLAGPAAGSRRTGSSAALGGFRLAGARQSSCRACRLLWGARQQGWLRRPFQEVLGGTGRSAQVRNSQTKLIQIWWRQPNAWVAKAREKGLQGPAGVIVGRQISQGQGGQVKIGWKRGTQV